MSVVLITGGTGAVGCSVAQQLQAHNHEVRMLSRSPESYEDSYPDVQFFKWNVRDHFIQEGALLGVDIIIHLAGKNVAEGRWTDKRKKEILDSRIDSARLLYDKVEKLSQKPHTFISASAVGYYGNRGDELLNENSTPGRHDFLAEVCIQWEQAADRFKELDIRVAKVRIGVVLDTDTGVLQKMIPPTKAGLISPLGKGDQYMSWIHIEDLGRLFVTIAETPTFEGVINGVSGHPVTNKELTESLAAAMGKSVILPKIPSFLLKTAMGEMAEIALYSMRVESLRSDLGFNYKFSQLNDALKDLVN